MTLTRGLQTEMHSLQKKHYLKRMVREQGFQPEDEEEYLVRLNSELEHLGFNLATDDTDYLTVSFVKSTTPNMRKTINALDLQGRDRGVLDSGVERYG